MRAPFVSLCIVSSLAVAGSAGAQSWTPPKGELYFGVVYQWLDSDLHLVSDDVAGPELTPLENLLGVDLLGAELDDGRVQSQVMILDADLGITDRLAAYGGVAFVESRWLASGLALQTNPSIEDGSWHGAFQDARLGLRYQAIQEGPWVVTPFVNFVFPTNEYLTLGHNVIGRGLNELQVGTGVGRLLRIGGAPVAYFDTYYFYGFMEDPVPEFPISRSFAQFELGYTHRSMTVQGFATWQRVHDGLEWSQIGAAGHDVGNVLNHHDQVSATREWRLGGAVSFNVSDAVDLSVAFNRFLMGENTHNARTLTFGVSYGFQAFGGIGRSPRSPRDNDNGKDDDKEN